MTPMTTPTRRMKANPAMYFDRHGVVHDWCIECTEEPKCLPVEPPTPTPSRMQANPEGGKYSVCNHTVEHDWHWSCEYDPKCLPVEPAPTAQDSGKAERSTAKGTVDAPATHGATHLEDAPVCPHCGHRQRDAWEIDFGPGMEGETEMYCGECSQPFIVSKTCTIYYSTQFKKQASQPKQPI